MEKVLVILTDGTVYELAFEEGFNLETLKEKLNSNEITVLAIGNIVTHKMTIQYVKKVNETEINGNVSIKTHNSIDIVVKDDSYSPLNLEKEINSFDKSFIIIGDAIVNKGSIKTITPII